MVCYIQMGDSVQKNFVFFNITSTLFNSTICPLLHTLNYVISPYNMYVPIVRIFFSQLISLRFNPQQPQSLKQKMKGTKRDLHKLVLAQNIVQNITFNSLGYANGFNNKSSPGPSRPKRKIQEISKQAFCIIRCLTC